MGYISYAAATNSHCRRFHDNNGPKSVAPERNVVNSCTSKYLSSITYYYLDIRYYYLVFCLFYNIPAVGIRNKKYASFELHSIREYSMTIVHNISVV
jgi:hypothetical protein